MAMAGGVSTRFISGTRARISLLAAMLAVLGFAAVALGAQTTSTAAADGGTSTAERVQDAPTGPFTAKIKILNVKGEPAAGANYTLLWSRRGGPVKTVAEGKLPEDGAVEVKNLAGIEKPATREELNRQGGAPSYSLMVNGHRLGWISFFEYADGKYTPPAHGQTEEEFKFHIPPSVGDVAPDMTLHDIATSKTMRLSDLRGQVVLIDFWATWCGPCQEPMAENQEILRRNPDWKGKATILAVSINDDLETVRKHLEKNQWTLTHNTWAPADPSDSEKVGWDSPAADLYGIVGIPTMLIVDRDGVIRDRGQIDNIEAEMKKWMDEGKAAAAEGSSGERLGGGDVIKAPGAETSYSSEVKAPGPETSYLGGKSASAAGADGKIRVALFADEKSTQESSREAIWRVVSEVPDMTISKVQVEDVQDPAFFDSYDVFILPGGSGGGEAKAVGVEAGQELSRRVKEEGKGIIGICAGGYYVVEGWNPATSALDIINARNHDGEHWARGSQMIQVEVTEEDGTTATREMWFENGPIFKPADIEGLPGYVSLARYVTDLHAKDAPKGQMTGRDAVIAAPYGKGRVVAFGPHPELSESLNHWLVNAIKWTASETTGPITLGTVLEGKNGGR